MSFEKIVKSLFIFVLGWNLIITLYLMALTNAYINHSHDILTANTYDVEELPLIEDLK